MESYLDTSQPYSCSEWLFFPVLPFGDTFWHWQAAICVIVVVLLTVGGFYPKAIKNGVRDFSCGSNAVSRTDRENKKEKIL